MKSIYGAITYSKHGHNRYSQGTANGEVVVQIIKNKNHTHTNSGIYTVIVKGNELSDRHREITNARLAGQRAYELAIGD